MYALAGTLALLFLFRSTVLSSSAPLTCYSRVLELSGEIMRNLDTIHKSNRTKSCAERLPNLFLDVHNSCIMTKLRDFMYVTENLPANSCRNRPRFKMLLRRLHALYSVINRICYRELVFVTDDCTALDTGNFNPRYTEDRLQLLEEEEA